MTNGIIVSNLFKEIRKIVKAQKETNLTFLENINILLEKYTNTYDKEPILEYLNVLTTTTEKQTITEEKINIKNNKNNNIDTELNKLLQKIELLIKENETEILKHITTLSEIYNKDIQKQNIITESLIIFNDNLEKNKNTKKR